MKTEAVSTTVPAKVTINVLVMRCVFAANVSKNVPPTAGALQAGVAQALAAALTAANPMSIQTHLWPAKQARIANHAKCVSAGRVVYNQSSA